MNGLDLASVLDDGFLASSVPIVQSAEAELMLINVAASLDGVGPCPDTPAMRLALFEPDIPTNTGTIIRLSACLGVPLDIIEPCGFPFGDSSLRRAGLDYIDRAQIGHHLSWNDFLGSLNSGARLVLLTTKAAKPYTRFAFHPADVLLFGRESAGVPEHVHERADARIVVPMIQGLRSLNVAIAAGMVMGEALRQTDLLPVTEYDELQH